MRQNTGRACGALEITAWDYYLAIDCKSANMPSSLTCYVNMKDQWRDRLLVSFRHVSVRHGDRHRPDLKFEELG